MAETIFAGKKIKEFADENIFASLAVLFAVGSWFTEQVLMSNGPRDARNGYC